MHFLQQHFSSFLGGQYLPATLSSNMDNVGFTIIYFWAIDFTLGCTPSSGCRRLGCSNYSSSVVSNFGSCCSSVVLEEEQSWMGHRCRNGCRPIVGDDGGTS